MTRVMAQGAFDIIHPGILHYLRESAKLGDELIVVVARDVNRQSLVQDEAARQEIVASLDMVDQAVLGGTSNLFERVTELAPDIITLGPEQHWDAEELQDLLSDRDLSINIVTISDYDGPDGDTAALKDRFLTRSE